MDLTTYADKCIEPITEEIYDQVQYLSNEITQYMKHKHPESSLLTIKATIYDILMHYFEMLHDDPAPILEDKLEPSDIAELIENALADLDT